MALRTSITERQRRLGVELRKLREQAGVSISDGAESIGMGRTHLSHIEAARTAIPSDKLRALCHAYGCTRDTYIDALVGMNEGSGKGWWTAHRHREAQSALDLAELEAGAATICSHETLVIPGLLQTEGYIQAILSSVKPVRSTVEDVTAFRLQRQRILYGEGAPALHAVIHEAALHMHFGGVGVMREQLVRLIELARLPNVTIQVFPFRADASAAFSGSFHHIAPAVPELATVVLEHPVGPVCLDDQEHNAQYFTMFDRLTKQALPPIDPVAAPESHANRDSLGLIYHILYAL